MGTHASELNPMPRCESEPDRFRRLRYAVVLSPSIDPQRRKIAEFQRDLRGPEQRPRQRPNPAAELVGHESASRRQRRPNRFDDLPSPVGPQQGKRDPRNDGIGRAHRMLAEDVRELFGAAVMDRQTAIFDGLEGSDEIGTNLDAQQRAMRRHGRQQSAGGASRTRSQLDDVPGGRQTG